VFRFISTVLLDFAQKQHLAYSVSTFHDTARFECWWWSHP